MRFSSVIGIILGFGALAVAISMEGADLGHFAEPSAAIIVFGGTIGATLMSFPLTLVTKLPKLIARAFTGGSSGMSVAQVVELFVHLAEKARKEGLLSLEEEVVSIEDPFVRKGMLLVVDGIDPEVVRDILDVDIAAMADRHHLGYGMLEAMGGYAPTMGIIGTVMGLVHVLSSLDDPSQLGGAIAVAFIATLYGVASANLLWLPLGGKLKAQSKEEAKLREVALEGILAVQAGDNPRIVREKLEAFLAVGERGGKLAKTGASHAEQTGAGKAPAIAAGRG